MEEQTRLYVEEVVLRAIVQRLSTLEENVATLEEWCQEQQDLLDQLAGDGRSRPGDVVRLQVVGTEEIDLRHSDDAADAGARRAEHERRVAKLREGIDRAARQASVSGRPAPRRGR